MITKYIVRFYKGNDEKEYEEEYTNAGEAVNAAMRNAHLNTEVIRVDYTIIWSSSDN